MTEHIQSTDYTLQYTNMQFQVVPVLYVRSSLLWISRGRVNCCGVVLSCPHHQDESVTLLVEDGRNLLRKIDSLFKYSHVYPFSVLQPV